MASMAVWHRCCRCGRRTDVAYTDGGALALVHGAVYCRECYLADGHAECPGCQALLYSDWAYCPKCGRCVREGSRG